MKEYKTFEEYINRIRELSGIKPDDDILEGLESKGKPLSESELKSLNESNLNRINQHMIKHDIAAISAWREENIQCMTYKSGQNAEIIKDKVFTREEKDERNIELNSGLLKKGYGVTYIRGISHKDREIVKENSYLVVNLKDDVNFIKNIIKLGQFYCQDFVLIKEKDNNIAYNYGTNYAKYPGFNKKSILGEFHPGLENEFMSKIHGRPFYFGEEKEYREDDLIQFENYDELGFSGRYGITKLSENIINLLF